MPVGTIAARLNALARQVAVGGDLHLPTLLLFSNPIAPTPNTLMADLAECTFDGYAAVAGVVYGTPYIDVNGTVRVDAPSADFVSTGATVIETVYGWALTDAGKADLYYAEALDTPVPIAAASQGLRVDPSIPYGA